MNKKRIHVVLDAMGGDYAPHAAVEGAVLACREYPVDITLVGNRAAIIPHLQRLDAVQGDPIFVHHTSQVVAMGDNPLDVIRKKKFSSIRVGLELVKKNKGDVFVSAGNSGAVAAGSVFVLKRIEGIDRPVISAVLPTLGGKAIIADAGANTQVKAFNLVQFAIMAAVHSRLYLKCPEPRVALLSNGQEEAKGTEATREAHRLLKNSSLNYIGYIEGRDVFRTAADVVVCDGFSGNILLKTAEGVAESIGAALKQESKKSLITLIGALLAKKAFQRLQRRFDYAEYGGAPILGLTAPVLICHGRSFAPAIKNAIKAGMEYTRSNAVELIQTEIAASRDLKAIGKKPSLIKRMLHDINIKHDKSE